MSGRFSVRKSHAIFMQMEIPWRMTLSWSRWIHSRSSLPISFRSILILSFHVYLHFSLSWSLPFRFTNCNLVGIYHLFHACWKSHPSHPLFDHPSIWWGVQVMKLLIMQSSPASFHFLPLRSKYSPWHPVPDTLNLCSSFRATEAKFRTRIRQQIKSHFRILYFVSFFYRRRKIRDSELPHCMSVKFWYFKDSRMTADSVWTFLLYFENFQHSQNADL
jgi:hypothetical protein